MTVSVREIIKEQLNEIKKKSINYTIALNSLLTQ